MDYLMLGKVEFEFFVMSVLRQIAARNRQEITFGKIISAYTENKASDKYLKFDAVAPNGFGDFKGCIYFEFKKLQKRSSTEAKSIESFRRKIRTVNWDQAAIGILIVDGRISESITYEDPINNEIPIYVWGQQIIEQWVREYPIDYSNAVNLSDKKTSKELSANDYISNITENDFAEKKWKNLDSVVHVVEKADNFALVLGAGISVDPGAKSWDTLLKQFTAELQRQRLIDDSKALSKKIGGSSLIIAQLCKELYTTEADYYWAIHQGLYAGRQAINKKYAIYHIAKIISKCISKKHFRVLTYNYDDYLETYLKNENVSYNTLYNEDCETDDKLSIYHVHGYMPQVNAKTNMLDAHKKSIFLTEQNYNDLYNNPYSWQIASQLSFFRENICLFVGCSLADPNIRRLLEITYRKTKVHYAILAKEKLTNKDLMKASNHFARLGVEIIWANDFNEIPILLQNFYR